MLMTLQWSTYDWPLAPSLSHLHFFHLSLLTSTPSQAGFFAVLWTWPKHSCLEAARRFPTFFCLGSSFSTYMNGSHFLWISTQMSLQLGVPVLFKTSVPASNPQSADPFPYFPFLYDMNHYVLLYKFLVHWLVPTTGLKTFTCVVPKHVESASHKVK